jgi:tRNA(adenine34) deaminase
MVDKDIKFMKEAYKQALKAYKQDEVPIGAVLVVDNKIISKNYNQNRSLIDPTAHAEILVLREAAKKLGVFRLTEAEVYITLEPCPMCAGALVYSRVKRVVYGCNDPKSGCSESVMNILDNKKFNHRIKVCKNVMGDESSKLLKKFFKEKRK